MAALNPVSSCISLLIELIGVSSISNVPAGNSNKYLETANLYWRRMITLLSSVIGTARAAPGCLIYPYSPSCPFGSSILFISKLNFLDFNSDIFSLKMDLFKKFILPINFK